MYLLLFLARPNLTVLQYLHSTNSDSVATLRTVPLSLTCGPAVGGLLLLITQLTNRT